MHADSLCLLELCRKIERVAPADPIVKHGLEMMDFDKLLEKHQQDTEVRGCIAKIMGAPNPLAVQSERVQDISVKDVIEMHRFMLQAALSLDSWWKQELQKLTEEYSSLSSVDREAPSTS